MSDAIRLAKRVAQELGCSRRQAEQYIEGGWVSVDGTIIEEPAERITPEQHVRLDPAAVAEDVPPASILLHKQAGVDLAGADILTASLAPQHRADGQQAGMRSLRKHFRNLQNVAPLPGTVAGLVVLSQDWRIARRLLEDRQRIEQEFLVDVDREISSEALAQAQRIAAKRHVLAKISQQSERRLRFAVKGADPTVILEICAAADLPASRVTRMRIGRISLAGLQPGQWRYLRSDEWF
jgi:23S rRNA pseudouridine2604 synthase